MTVPKSTPAISADPEPIAALRVVAYLRVSTERQAEDGCGLDIQRDAIEAWAKAHGATVVASFADETSGTNGLAHRLGLVDALDAVKSQGLAGIVVYRLDRWARDVIVQESLLKELQASGGRLFSTVAAEQQNLEGEPDDPTRRLVRQILGAIADYDRAMVVARMEAGRQRRRREGQWWTGEPPYGWKTAGKGQLVPDEAEQGVIAWIVRQRAEGFSWRDIVDRLNEAGKPAPRGGRWHASTARRVALSPNTLPPGAQNSSLGGVSGSS